MRIVTIRLRCLTETCHPCVCDRQAAEPVSGFKAGFHDEICLYALWNKRKQL